MLLLLPVGVGALGFSGCAKDGDPFVIGLVNMSPGLIPNVDSYQVEVADQLAEVGLDVEFIEVSPGVPDLDVTIEDLLADNPDLVVTWTTPTSVTVARHLEPTDVPMVFGNVNDPVGADLVTSLENPGRNVTGIGGMLHHRRTISLLQRVASAEKDVQIYKPGGAASPSILALDRKMGDDLNVEMVEIAVETDDELVELLAAPRPSGVDAVVLFGSPFQLRSQESVVVAARAWGLPLAIGTGSAIPEDALVFVHVLKDDVVHQMAVKTVAISQGAEPVNMPVQPGALVTHLNLNVASRLDITISDEALLLFDHVVSPGNES